MPSSGARHQLHIGTHGGSADGPALVVHRFWTASVPGRPVGLRHGLNLHRLNPTGRRQAAAAGAKGGIQMNSRANSFRAFPVLLAFLLNLVVGPLAPLAQTSPVAALSGTSFNATDGNLVDNSGPEVDWCTPAPGLVPPGIDTPSGQTDNSFKASSDQDPVPTIENGSIPNNKVDFDRL
jgi:hypothetical protein